MKRLVLLVIITVFFVSCNLSYYDRSRNRVTRSEEINFNFKIQIIDVNKSPIENAYVELSFKNGASYKAETIFDTAFTTSKNAFYEKSISANSNTVVVDYYVKKKGYCNEEGYFRKDSDITLREPVSFITLNKDGGNIVDFNLKCVGLNGAAIQDIIINYHGIVKGDSSVYSGLDTSDSKGFISGLLVLSCNDMKEIVNLIVESKNDDYYLVKETFRDLNKLKKETFSLEFISKKDFFDTNFIESNDYKNLKKSIIGFIDLLQLNSLLTNSILEYNSINIVEFKSKRYLTFDFNHTNEYNSLQLDKYDIAKRMFDEVIRKVLNPLNDNLENSKEFAGYKLLVKTKTRSFTDDKDSGEELVYEFYIPKTTVKSYKNLDLTGQQVLDNSIILLNGERIDLKLQ